VYVDEPALTVERKNDAVMHKVEQVSLTEWLPILTVPSG